MNRYDIDKHEEVSGEDKSAIMAGAERLLKESMDSLTDKMRTEIFNDIENYLYERLEEVKRKYFDEVFGFLLGENKDHELKPWLEELGYTQQSFRQKIYEDNKEEINNAIAKDYVFDVLEKTFATYYGHWEWDDVKIGYPQSKVMDGFARAVISNRYGGFRNHVLKMLDDEARAKFKQFDEISAKLADARNMLSEIEQE